MFGGGKLNRNILISGASQMSPSKIGTAVYKKSPQKKLKGSFIFLFCQAKKTLRTLMIRFDFF